MANFELTPPQTRIFQSKAKFKVVAAGRRGGKSWFAALMCIMEASKLTNKLGQDLSLREVWYVAPTLGTAQGAVWALLKDMGHKAGVIAKNGVKEKDATIVLTNGRKIRLKGADRPDNLRGAGLSYLVLDEYADMKSQTWGEILAPTLLDCDGDALFIGTPKGKNHFYKLYIDTRLHDEWEAFHFTTTENPHLPQSAVKRLLAERSAFEVKQELEASFETTGANILDLKGIQIVKTPMSGDTYMAVDYCGFKNVQDLVKSRTDALDDSAYCVANVSAQGWYIPELHASRETARQSALRVVQMGRKYSPRKVGIEKGVALNGAQEYLQDYQKRMRWYTAIQHLSHGNQNKVERIVHALQGRMEKGMIFVPKDAYWLGKFFQQIRDFPNPMAHDDMLDALAYIAQLAKTPFNNFDESDLEDFEILDTIAGY